MLFKTCTKCAIEQDVTCFAPIKAGKYGAASECRSCARERARVHYKDHREAYASSDKTLKYLANKNYRENIVHKLYALGAQRRVLSKKATPSWADKEAIAGMYQLAAIFNSTGINLHVDHIIPLKSSKVSGLHCEANLQLLSATENIIKGNRYWDDMWTTA